MKNPVLVIFSASFLYNFKKSQDHLLSLGYAYATTALTLAFSYSSIVGLIALLTGYSDIFDKYGYFGSAVGFTLFYIGIIAGLAVVIDALNSSGEVILEYSKYTWLKDNLGTIYITPIFVSMILTLTFAFIV